MSEKRFVSEYVEIIDENGSRQAVCVTDNEHTVSFEVKDEYVAMDLAKKLNEQQSTIQSLKKENEQLKQEVKNRSAFIIDKGLGDTFVRWKNER